jgi:very-short-patch-repair endonuclease
MKPISFKIDSNGRDYYLADELREYHPLFFYGCSKTIRQIINRKNIPQEEYLFVNKLKNKWNITDITSKKAKLLISQNWIEQNQYFETKQEETKENEIKTDLKESLKDSFLDIRNNYFRYNGQDVFIIVKDNIAWFRGNDVAKLLEYEDPANAIYSNVIENDKISFSDLMSNFVFFPNFKIDPKTKFINKNGIQSLLLRTRKPIDISLYRFFDINPFNQKWICKEANYLNKLIKIFGKYHTYQLQYSIDNYKVDLYFDKLNLVIECDEFGHSHYDDENEKQRQLYIENKLKCKFIRFNPDVLNFDFTDTISQIYNYIQEYKLNESEENLENKFINLEEHPTKEIKERDKIIYDLKNENQLLEMKTQSLELSLKDKNKLIETLEKDKSWLQLFIENSLKNLRLLDKMFDK